MENPFAVGGEATTKERSGLNQTENFGRSFPFQVQSGSAKPFQQKPNAGNGCVKSIIKSLKV
jgi:hypothetical protein